jgi:hypothetical protein
MGLSRDLTARELAGHAGGIDQLVARVLPDGRVNREQAARYLGITPKTLAHWQLAGKGPASMLVGGRRFYWKRDLDAFIRGDTA